QTARPSHSYSPAEFDREARRIIALTFDTLALSAGESVVFCGFEGSVDYIRRALTIGCKVSVIEAREATIRDYADLGVRTIRGSTSVIPARENAFDVAVATCYLHEVDPSFHSQIITELSRVARRVAIVELAPPSDPLGRRIAALYSRAKREFGSFEHYQPMEYWKKLLAMAKVEISQSVFQFAKLPPIEYLIDTVDLLLDTIEAEEAPEEDLEELRRIAQRSNAMLLPQARLVLVGASAGEIPRPTYSDAALAMPDSVQTVTSEPTATAAPARPVMRPTSFGEPSIEAAPAAASATTPSPAIQPAAIQPAAPPPSPAAAAPSPTAPAPAISPLPPIPNIGENPFGLPDTQPAATTREIHPPFGAPFAVPPAPDQAPFTPSASPTVPGWTWEPPEDDLSDG
ncbi:MAG: class I SAM-dependent methyltransferase, partial [Vulcanimicrobiaceae bacterium]